MTAWVLRWRVDYEGDYMLGVYATREAAEAAAVDWWHGNWGDLLLELWEGPTLREGYVADNEGDWRVDS